MKVSAVAALFFLVASVYGSAVHPRGSPNPRDLTKRAPSARSGPSDRKVKRDLILGDNLCPDMHTACGVSSPWSRNGWECIDTYRDLESCGGCVAPLDGQESSGVDCTEIDGVEDVACVRGFCTVYSCREGYAVSADTQSCVATNPKADYHHAGAIHRF